MAEAKFLVVRLGSLGDIVHAFPAVGGLRQSFPNAEIVWLTHPKWEALVRAGVEMDIRGARYDEFTAQQRDAIVKAWPSEAGFKKKIIEAYARRNTKR